MIDAVTAIGIGGTLATVLMVLGMLYLTYLGFQSDRREREAEAEPESEPIPE